MEYLKKAEYTGCHQGMRYRLEGADGGKKLKCTIWPEPFNFFTTPDSEKETAEFPFEEEGVVKAVAWMNERLSEEKNRWEHAGGQWDSYQ